MNIEENEPITNQLKDENPIDEINGYEKAKLSYLKEEIEDKQEKLKKMKDLYDIYNNLLEHMTNLYAYKVRELNDVLNELGKFYKKLDDKEFELNDLNYLIEKAKSELKEIEELKANSLNLPYF